MERRQRADAVPGDLPWLFRTRPSRADGTAFSVAGIVVVVAFGFLIAKTHVMTHLDLQGVKALNALHTGVLGALGSVVYRLFSPVEAVALTVLIVVIIWVVSKNVRLAATFAFTVAVTWVSSDVVKLLVHRSRPDATAFPHHLAQRVVDPSYPSGHMVFVSTLALTLFFLARGTRSHILVAVAGAVVTVIVGACLIADGVHYPTDVIASAVWAAAVTPLVLGLSNRHLLPRTYRLPSSVETLV